MTDLITHIGILFYPLCALSLMGASLIIERGLFFMRLPAIDKANSFIEMKQELNQNSHLEKSIRDELISFRLQEIQKKLTHGIYFLRLIAILSPMVGLLGTVLGMIEAFSDIAAQDGPIAPNMIADGLWNAMLTTAYGLSIALPCLLAAFLYARMAEKRMDSFQHHLNLKSFALAGVKLS